MSTHPVPKDEIAASLQAGRELGPEYDDAVASALAERLDASIAAQVRTQLDARIAEGSLQKQGQPQGMSGNTLRLVMGIVSLGVGIPLSAIAASVGGAVGLVVAWIGIITIYLVVVRGARD